MNFSMQAKEIVLLSKFSKCSICLLVFGRIDKIFLFCFDILLVLSALLDDKYNEI